MHIGIVGTFDLANFGDVLFPVLTEDALRRRLGDVELRRYSYRPMAASAWFYDVEPLSSLPGDLDELDLLVIGGGHLLRFDRPLAEGYEPTDPVVHDPGGLWLTPTLLAAVRGVPVVWNALGAWGERADWTRGLVRAALASATRVTVRDRESAAWLYGFDADAPVHVTPDTGFGAARLVPAEPSEEWRAFLDAAAVHGPYIVVQPSPALVAHPTRVARVLAAARAADMAVLELPISPVLGDAPGVLELDGPVARAPDWPHPRVLAEVIARAEGVVAQSMHLSIAALTAGVPVHRPPSPEHLKSHELQALDGVHLLSSADEPALGRRSPGTDVQERAAQVEAHWDEVAGLAGRRTPDTRAAERLLAELPAILQSLGDRAVAGEDSLAVVTAERDSLRSTLELTLEEADRAKAHLRSRYDDLVARRSVRLALRVADSRPRRRRA